MKQRPLIILGIILMLLIATFFWLGISHMALPDASVGMNEREIGIGETQQVGGIRITLNRLVQDSRCGADEHCDEAGAVTANVTLESGSDRETFNMPSDEAPHAFDAFKVSIVGVTPPRLVGKDPDPSAYRITFHVDPIAQ